VARDQVEGILPTSAKLDLLSSPDGEVREASLTLDGVPEERTTASTRLTSDVLDKCREWHFYVESLWGLPGKGAIEVWRGKHREMAEATKRAVSAALLPGNAGGLLAEAVSARSGGRLLLEVRADSEQVDSMPLELLGQPGGEGGAQVVVWRSRAGPVARSPSLRLLVARSAPVDVSLPQNEDEVRAIGTYVGRGQQGIATELLGNSTYEDFVLKTQDFRPGVVHLATHGTRDAFQFNSPPSNDPVGYDSLVRYFARRESVAAVVSTACFSAQPTILGNKRLVCFAGSLVDVGLSAAIGMASKITPHAAKTFTEALYTEFSRGRTVVEAYAEAVLAVRGMAEYDHLLWSVPVMYSRSRNVIPFPDPGYLDLLDRLRSAQEGIKGLRCRLSRLPAMSRDARIAVAGGLALDMAVIRQDLTDIWAGELPGTSRVPDWGEKLQAAGGQLDWYMSQVGAAAGQGQAAPQASAIIATVLDEVEQLLIAGRHVIAVDR
jgi:hypothetical protein